MGDYEIWAEMDSQGDDFFPSGAEDDLFIFQDQEKTVHHGYQSHSIHLELISPFPIPMRI